MKYVYFLFSLFYLCVSDARANYYGYYPKKGLTGHIIGGVEVPIAMYPYVAAITINNDAVCGGSIISDRVILTAAHCTFERRIKGYLRPDAFEVRLGSSFLDRGVLYEVCKVVPHELYSPSVYFYDIAVLMLDRRIKFGSLVRKVEIAPDNSWRKEKYSFTIAGFGVVSLNSDVSAKLRATRMTYVDSTTCNQSQSFKPMIVPNHMFCMIGQRWTSDCFGDSGSGVMWKGYLVGLVSTGRDHFCGADMMPSMYTDVPFFRKWIESKIKEADTLTSRDCDSRKNKWTLRELSNRPHVIDVPYPFCYSTLRANYRKNVLIRLTHALQRTKIVASYKRAGNYTKIQELLENACRWRYHRHTYFECVQVELHWFYDGRKQRW